MLFAYNDPWLRPRLKYNKYVVLKAEIFREALQKDDGKIDFRKPHSPLTYNLQVKRTILFLFTEPEKF